MRLLFVVPTTGGPLVVTALRPRPGLPISAAFAAGDFRSLAWSDDYARLCAPGGALCRVLPQLAPHELRLSGSFDTGRSWEAPVALAHLLLAQGHACAAQPAQAQAMIWTTGALDLDLALTGGDYALCDKIEKSALLLAQVPPTAQIFVIFPPARDADAAFARLQALAKGRTLTRLEALSMVEGAAALRQRLVLPGVRGDAGAQTRRHPFGRAAAAGALLAVAGAAGTYALMGPQRQAVEAGEVKAGENKAGETKAGETKMGETKADGEKTTENAAPAAVSARLRISEIRPPAGSDCRKLLFAPAAAELHAVAALDAVTFTPSKLESTLCGIAIETLRAGDRFAVTGDLPAAALAPAVGQNGAAAYVLRAGRGQNIVYEVQVSGAPASGQPPMVVFHHTITR